MAKETSFLDAAGDAIRTALTPVLGKKKREDGSEAETVPLRQPRPSLGTVPLRQPRPSLGTVPMQKLRGAGIEKGGLSPTETVPMQKPRPIGAGITGGAALLNPVAATGAALLGTTQDAGRGDYVVEKGSIQDLIRNGSAATRAIGLQQAEEAKKKMFTEAMRIYRTTK